MYLLLFFKSAIATIHILWNRDNSHPVLTPVWHLKGCSVKAQEHKCLIHPLKCSMAAVECCLSINTARTFTACPFLERSGIA